METDNSIELRIQRIALALPILVQKLRRNGYRFADADAVLPGPESSVDVYIERIESEVGAIPYAIALFWRIVGSVNLCGSHPDWSGCDYPDPLVVESASHAVADLQECVEDREERMRFNFPYLIPISPDDYHKEDVSGGMWYNVDCPATSNNPIINDERHQLSFLDYLDLALRQGGFLGLDKCPDHTWPINDLAVDVTHVQ